MKKTLLFALMFFAAGLVSAQDMELLSVSEPDATQPLDNQDTITVRFQMINNGPGQLDAGVTYSGQIRFGTGNPITLNGQPLSSAWPAGQTRTVTLLNNYAMAGVANGGWEICAWINNTSQYGPDPIPANDTACATFTVQDPPPPAGLEYATAIVEGFNYGNGVLSYNFINAGKANRSFSLMNLTGQVLWRTEISDAYGSVALQVENPGIYILLMESDANTGVESKKIFVQ